MKPSVGRTVHYHDSGESPAKCRAAIIAAVQGEGDAYPDDQVSLVILNPNGVIFEESRHDEGGETAGSPDCPQQSVHGNPFRYCSCGWMEASRSGGTWHWPERVE